MADSLAFTPRSIAMEVDEESSVQPIGVVQIVQTPNPLDISQSGEPDLLADDLRAADVVSALEAVQAVTALPLFPEPAVVQATTAVGGFPQVKDVSASELHAVGGHPSSKNDPTIDLDPQTSRPAGILVEETVSTLLTGQDASSSSLGDGVAHNQAASLAMDLDAASYPPVQLPKVGVEERSAIAHPDLSGMATETAVPVLEVAVASDAQRPLGLTGTREPSPAALRLSAPPDDSLPLTSSSQVNGDSHPVAGTSQLGPSFRSFPSQLSASSGPLAQAGQLLHANPGSSASSSLPTVMTRTGYIYDKNMLMHCQDGYIPTSNSADAGPNAHPEEPMRIKRIYMRLRDAGLTQRMKQLPISEVTQEQVALVHAADHWDKVQGTEFMTDEMIQESKDYYEQLSLYVCRQTAMCARLSCGGVIQACRSVCRGEVRNAFAIVRPPGHHAEPDEHMGFCFFNNVAVAAKEVQRLGLAKKVMILDWDVHHGNGTQRAFWEDPNVLYISIHRHDGGKFYPTSDFGALDMVGGGPGEGKSVNIPWPQAGFGDADYIYAFQKIVMPIAYEFAPDLVIISAGFDAAEHDTLGGCLVTPPAYGHMTHMLCALAGGKVVVALEGGYNLRAISDSSLAVASVLLGETPAELGALEASEIATEVIWQVAKVQSKYWKSIDMKACQPPEVSNTDNFAPVIAIPDLLKIHRAHHMFTKHKLYQIPLASLELENAFGGQIICNEGVYEAGDKSVLVIFVHDFGNLRVETDGASSVNVNLENSYLLDTSDIIVDWIHANGFSLIDVNVLRQIPTHFERGKPQMITKAGGDELQAKLLRYLWDNYVEISEAETVIFIGLGTGCAPLLDLVNSREVERKVKAVVQVAGLHSLVRPDASNENRRRWFSTHNQIYVPAAHPILLDERVKRRLGERVFSTDKAKVVDVLNAVFPSIQDFILSKVEVPPARPPPMDIDEDGPPQAMTEVTIAAAIPA